MTTAQTRRFDYLVSVSEAAFQSIVIAAIESFLVRGPTGSGSRHVSRQETFGLLWGYETTTASGAQCFNVEVATVDVNATRGKDYVVPSGCLKTVNAALPAYWPNLRFMGDFHSHPYDQSEGWPHRPFLSKADQLDVECNDTYAESGFRVALLVSIKKLKHKGTQAPRFTYDNTLEFRLNDLRMSLAAWVACPTKNDTGAPALYLLPRPKTVAVRDWEELSWHRNYRHLNHRSVWLNAPLHHLLTRLGG